MASDIQGNRFSGSPDSAHRRCTHRWQVLGLAGVHLPVLLVAVASQVVSHPTPRRPASIRWEDFRAGLVRLDLSVVERVAEEITGGLGGPVRFSLARAVSPAQAANGQALVRYITHEFCRNEVA